MTIATRTLEAKLVRPTAHKERKLSIIASNYRAALKESFNCRATTMSAVNDIVTPYRDLPYPAKDALKRYVPQLFSKYQASKLGNDHPIRFTNRAAKFDLDETRHHQICWQVPQPGRGMNFWIPLAINPEQLSDWKRGISETADFGELRLIERRKDWYLQATVSFDDGLDEHELIDFKHHTIIGVDIGESSLLTASTVVDNKPIRPLIISGNPAKRIRKEIFTIHRRLRKRAIHYLEISNKLEYHRNQLSDLIEKASRDCVDYALEFSNPVIVMEDLSGIRERIDYTKFINRRLHSWAFSRLQRRIEHKALELSIPTAFVNPAYTSIICHECGYIGYRRKQGTFRCRNDQCWVTTYQADINAAVNIAKRANPWGESCQLKFDDDESSRDGSSSGGAMSPTNESTAMGGLP